MYYVYRLTNHTKQEIYHGITEYLKKRIEEHCNNETKAINHWSCKGDRIDRDVVTEHLNQKEASDKAHQLEEYFTPPKDYKVLNTRGI